jgi:aspartyl-tRNA(Asn)/glutamyl-tRNA(Gln) amidotransferase subunit C
MKPMNLRSGQGAKRSDANSYREHLQRRPGRKDTISCFDAYGSQYQVVFERFCSKSRRFGRGCGKGGIITQSLPDSSRRSAFAGRLGAHFSSFSMSLTSSDIARIASLARLQLEHEESERMRAQINGFFSLVERMRAVDTTGVEPLAHPVAALRDVTLRLAEDVASEPDDREANQRSAPAVENGLYLVPKVIE